MTIYTYKGKPLETLSPEELLEACKWAFGALDSERKWARITTEMEDEFKRTEECLRRM